MEVATEATADLRRTLDTLRRRKAWIIGALAVTVLASLGLSLRATKLYGASSQVLLVDPFQTSLFTDTPLGFTDPKQIADSQIAVVESPGVAQQVAKRLGPRYRPVRARCSTSG
jgi:uncharacterized protein involved in exopolysaccharide biosynthesis